MLLTLSPLYSSPEGDFRARLACLIHTANVRSEPGSNPSIEVFNSGFLEYENRTRCRGTAHARMVSGFTLVFKEPGASWREPLTLLEAARPPRSCACDGHPSFAREGDDRHFEGAVNTRPGKDADFVKPPGNRGLGRQDPPPNRASGRS